MTEESVKIDEILKPDQVQVLNLGPNDYLVLMYEGFLNEATVDRLKNEFAEHIGHSKVIVLTDGMKVGVIHKTDA